MEAEVVVDLRRINSSTALVLLLEFIKEYGVNYLVDFVYSNRENNDKHIATENTDINKIIISNEIANKYLNAVEFLKKCSNRFLINLVNDSKNIKLLEYFKDNIADLDLLLENAKVLKSLRVNSIYYIPNFKTDSFERAHKLGIQEPFLYKNPWYDAPNNKHPYICRSKPYTDGQMMCELIKDSKGLEEWFDIKFSNQNWVLISHACAYFSKSISNNYCGFKQISQQLKTDSPSFTSQIYTNTFTFDASKLPNEEELYRIETPKLIKTAREEYYKGKHNTPIDSI